MISVNENYRQVFPEKNELTGLVEQGTAWLSGVSKAYFDPSSLIVAGEFFFVRQSDIIATEDDK